MKKQAKTAVQNENSLSVIPKARPSYEDIELINPKKIPLTPDVLRTFEGFGQASDEEAQNICRTSFEFAYILLDFLARKNNSYIDNQQVVSLKENETPIIGINESQSKPPKNKAA
jgi:hypothetical protein